MGSEREDMASRSQPCAAAQTRSHEAEPSAAFTPGPWETSCHRLTVGNPNRWTVREHEFPDYPYEGQLEREWGVYPPLGHCGPVALVAGEENARLIAAAPEMLEALKELHLKTVVGTVAERHAALDRAWAAIVAATSEAA